MVPPSHFGNPAKVPNQYGIPEQPISDRQKANSSQENDHDHSFTPARPDRPFRELLTLLAMFTLAYLALDNYAGRIKLEKLNNETSAINVKTLQLQQQNFLNTRKQQELRMLRERVDVTKRCYKMALHIAMLRKQLEDLGAKPADITQVILEFELNVRMNNSVQNLTGQAIWLDDASPLTGYVPDYREYDRKGQSSSP